MDNKDSSWTVDIVLALKVDDYMDVQRLHGYVGHPIQEQEDQPVHG
jgi:hypothetical protein